LDNASQVVKELALELRSHDFALSFKENGKSLKRMASFETPFILIVLHFSKKDEICVLGFSKGDPLFLLEKCDEPRIKLEIVRLDGGPHNA